MKTIFFRSLSIVGASVLFAMSSWAAVYHVSIQGCDKNAGTIEAPFRHINHAAALAQPGDTVLVHKGIYREEVVPQRGGHDDLHRIVYKAADGEHVVIKGSEVVKKWKKVKGTVWKAVVPNTLFKDYNPYTDVVVGDWYSAFPGYLHHTGEVFINGQSMYEQTSLEKVVKSEPIPKKAEVSKYTWYCEVDDENTTIWANFHNFDPNKELVEINARKSCFYPERVGVNYLTVSGFEMSQAATQWAAPTAEQIGLIGTHWSKGWIIENNVISNSKCVGISLGKDRATGHNCCVENPEKDGSVLYAEVILRALRAGWSKELVGSHIVRHNIIHDCGQAGVVGSLGAINSVITNNHIYDIYTHPTYGGAEMGGIKLHAAIDVLIANNRIHNTFHGIWLDWMAQGTRVSSNILYDNANLDLFMEVDYGPIIVDNNLLLSVDSYSSYQICSEGVSLIHNLTLGRMKNHSDLRWTPYHVAHSTQMMGYSFMEGGDNRFYNNIFAKTSDKEEIIEDHSPQFKVRVGYGLNGFDVMKYDCASSGNVFYKGAKPYKLEKNSIVNNDYNFTYRFEDLGDEGYLYLDVDGAIDDVKTTHVTTSLLGSTKMTEALFENYDGKPLSVDTDFFGQPRNLQHPKVGPFENLKQGQNKIKLW